MSNESVKQYLEFQEKYEEHLMFCFNNNNAHRTDLEWNTVRAEDFYKRGLHKFFQSNPEPEGMDEIFSKICELITIGQKGEAKKIFKQVLSTRSEGWATDEEVETMLLKFAFEEGNRTATDTKQWFTDYKSQQKKKKK